MILTIKNIYTDGDDDGSVLAVDNDDITRL